MRKAGFESDWGKIADDFDIEFIASTSLSHSLFPGSQLF